MRAQLEWKAFQFPTMNRFLNLIISHFLYLVVALQLNFVNNLVLTLAFDPSKSPFYKVVLIGYYPGDKERSGSYLIHIYSSKTSSGKEMHANAPHGGSSQLRVFWSGAIHWMNPANVHIRLEVDAENLTGTRLPKAPYILAECKIRFLGECGGSLLLIQTRAYVTLRFKILEMKKDCFRWIVKYRVNLRPVISEFRHLPRFSVLCCANGPDKKDLVLVLHLGGKVIAYNLNLKSVKVLLNLYCSSYHSYDNTYQFISSFSPV